MPRSIGLFLFWIVVVLFTGITRADIYRWDNGALIPGTEEIDPGPYTDLANWNTELQNLRFAELSGLTLSSAQFSASWLDNAHLTNADVTWANLSSTVLSGASLEGAVVRFANFEATTSGGFTKQQLYSTASYRSKNLSGIGLSNNNLSSWDFSDQRLLGAQFASSLLANATLQRANLTGSNLDSAVLNNADLSGAVIAEASLNNITSRGFSKEQLYSTASYQAKDLRRTNWSGNDLSGWDFSGQHLINASFGSILTNTNFTAAVITGAYFDESTSRGFTAAQLYSTASYQAKNLEGVRLSNNDLSGWSFRGENLKNAHLTLQR